MKTRKENWRSFIVTLTMALFMATMLMACPSKAASAGETKETEAADIKEETVEVAEVKETEPTIKPTPEPTMEPTPEPTPEPIVYEGIDMESTLPGKEWIATFRGIIDEPKFVVFNDEINKKVIVENEGEVEFAEGDVLVVFEPADILLLGYDGKNLKEIVNYDTSYNVVIFEEGKKVVPNTITVDIAKDGKRQGQITCKLKAPTNKATE